MKNKKHTLMIEERIAFSSCIAVIKLISLSPDNLASQ